MMKNADCVSKQSWHYNYIFTVSPCHCYYYREFFQIFQIGAPQLKKLKTDFFAVFSESEYVSAESSLSLSSSISLSFCLSLSPFNISHKTTRTLSNS